MNLPTDSRWVIDLLLTFTSKELRSRYKSTVLGFMWMIIYPLLQFLVLGMVFTFFVPTRITNYPLFLLSGLIPWSFFSLAITNGTTSLLSNRELLKKSRFPRSIIPLSAILAAFVQFCLSLGLFFIALIFLGQVRPAIFFILPAILLELLLTVGLVMISASLALYYRDVVFIVGAIQMIWFYLTPIFYDLSFVPSNWRILYSLNPMVGIILLYQIAFAGSHVHELMAVALSLVVSLFLLTFGFLLFRQRSPYFADWV